MWFEGLTFGLCRGGLASFKIPRRVYFVDRFPMTGSGKIQKYLLRDEARLRAADPESPFAQSDGEGTDHGASPQGAGVATVLHRRRT
jgi:hypothetical protein